MLFPKIVNKLIDVPKDDWVQGLYVFALEDTRDDGAKGVFYIFYKDRFIKIREKTVYPTYINY